jgi:hypothetical protein
MAGRGRQRTTFGKRERERKRQEKQAAKRARRHHNIEHIEPPTVSLPDMGDSASPEDQDRGDVDAPAGP